MLAENYCTIKEEAHVEFEEKRSLFIGHALHVESEEDALSFVKKLKREYADATHNVYAYHLKGGIIARYSDDGEPQGTAGMPVLDAIRKSGIDDVCIVVTRYFGGTLLGAGGLVRAYSHSAAIAIEAAGVINYQPYVVIRLTSGYSEYQKYQNMLAAVGAVIDETTFAEKVTVDFAVKRSQAEAIKNKILEFGCGRDLPIELGERFDYR